MTQKEQLLKLFADNGNQITLGMIMKTTLAAEYRARISELRNANYEILCTIDKDEPNNNLYTLYGEIDKKPLSIEKQNKIKDYTKTMLGYPENHNQREKIQVQIEGISNE